MYMKILLHGAYEFGYLLTFIFKQLVSHANTT